MVQSIRYLNSGGRRKKHILSDHSLSKANARRIADRHRLFGINARVIKHADGKYAVYRSCRLRQKKHLGKPTTKQIHVNRHMIGYNNKNPDNIKPPITIQTTKGSLRAMDVKIEGKSEIVYRPCSPLNCGATLWIKTDDPVVVDDCARIW